MNRKTFFALLSILAVMIVGVGVAVALLYSGTGGGKADSKAVAGEDVFMLLPAVPSDAAAVAVLSHSDLLDSKTIVSLHHSGELTPLYIYDAGRATSSPSEDVSPVIDTLRSRNMWVEFVDCSSLSDIEGKLSKRSILIASESEALVRSSVRHLEKAVSVIDAPGFSDAADKADGKDVLFVSNSHSASLLPSMLVRKYSSYAGFISRLADWLVFDIDYDEDYVSLDGRVAYDGEVEEFMTVLESSVPSESAVSAILPSYTRFVASLPLEDMDTYLDAYESYLDTRQALPKKDLKNRELKSKAGIDPETFFRSIGVKEVASASFMVGKNLETVNLVRVGKDAHKLLLADTGVKSIKDYVPAVHQWKYSGFLSAMFGDLFQLKDETCFTLMNGWLVSGSHQGVEEYVSGRVMEYTLEEYMSDASQDDLLAENESSFVSFFSFSDASSSLEDIFRKPFLEMTSYLWKGAEFCPAVLSVHKDKEGIRISVDMKRLELARSKAPAFERDATVYVPEGPFEVKNSGSGKMNKFYQNSHLSLCLSEDGRDLWGIPFKNKICGIAETIDYYANGKLQILFGAGSKMYLIDRLGRFVNGFPVEFGKEILLGPQSYDFNGTKRYNVMVLHKDNSLEMYNMKGEKPESWKGIEIDETIKSLPERIIVGGKSFWVVRTSIQTLIYPFVGGEPLTVFEGDKKIRPDSRITVVDVSSVEVDCYDGHNRNVKLK